MGKRTCGCLVCSWDRVDDHDTDSTMEFTGQVLRSMLTANSSMSPLQSWRTVSCTTDRSVDEQLFASVNNGAVAEGALKKRVSSGATLGCARIKNARTAKKEHKQK